MPDLSHLVSVCPTFGPNPTCLSGGVECVQQNYGTTTRSATHKIMHEIFGNFFLKLQVFGNFLTFKCQFSIGSGVRFDSKVGKIRDFFQIKFQYILIRAF